jgi:hypothetical protein
MSTRELEADYVVVGCGAVGMGFTDVILAESDASVIMVDRRAHPGGHWNDAYSFVRLHQPSAFYGVNSTPLGRGLKDERGPNAGMYELASGDEVRSYFDRVMRDRFLPSGRVQYLPMSEYHGDATVTSLLTGATTAVRARKKTVDARYIGSIVPSNRPPPFPVAPGVNIVPVNELSRLGDGRDSYVILGAGKTSADACLWLLDNGIDPSSIVWIRPRDSWFFNRASFQGGAQTLHSFAAQLEVVANASTLDELFDGLEAVDQMLRIDRGYQPTMFRGATSTRAEVELLSQITNVVRLGHVLGIDGDRITMEGERVETPGDCLFVDCTAPGIPIRPPVPIFSDDKITLQYVVYGGQPTYSAAVTAFIELAGDDDEHKNSICRPLPVTGDLLDVPRNLYSDLAAREQWLADEQILNWTSQSRLDPTTDRGGETEEERTAALTRFLTVLGPARSSLEKLLATADPAG